jgi:S-methyl-5-thioribose-1-phosphate isomerase
MKVGSKWYRAVWRRGNDVWVIDQRLLPHRFKLLRLKNHRETAEAIRNMTIRGAGTIGATGAFGLAQASLETSEKNFRNYIARAYETLVRTRPTAADLKHGLDRVRAAIDAAKNWRDAQRAAVAKAEAISDEYAANGEALGKHGAHLIKNGTRMLTHCNAGWLALQDWGSAPAPVYAAKRQGRTAFVWVDETRPRLQGANLTAWELAQEKIPHAIIADNAAGFFMRRGEVDLVIVGADRIAANGDTANKIGTYEKAVLAKEIGIPFYIAAPTSTFDPHCPTGDDIPIEERDENEVLVISGDNARGGLGKVRIAPKTSRARNPAFDVTPARYISGIITERGIVKPTRPAIRALLKKTGRL